MTETGSGSGDSTCHSDWSRRITWPNAGLWLVTWLRLWRLHRCALLCVINTTGRRDLGLIHYTMEISYKEAERLKHTECPLYPFMVLRWYFNQVIWLIKSNGVHLLHRLAQAWPPRVCLAGFSCYHGPVSGVWSMLMASVHSRCNIGSLLISDFPRSLTSVFVSESSDR